MVSKKDKKEKATPIPLDPKNDQYGQLVVQPNQTFTLKTDRNYAKEMSYCKAPNQYSTFKNNFHRLLTWKEVFRSPEYSLATPEPVEITFHFPEPSTMFVYKKFNRQNEVTSLDLFIRKLHCLRYCAEALKGGLAVQDLFDLLSVVQPMKDERERRTELMFQFGRGFRPTTRTAKGASTLGSYRAHIVKCMIKEPIVWPELLHYYKKRVSDSTMKQVMYLESVVKDPGARAKFVDNIKVFRSNNPKWWAQRLQMGKFQPIDFPHRRKDLIYYLRDGTSEWFRQLTPYSLYSDLVEWPLYTAGSLHFCRSLVDFRVKVLASGAYKVMTDAKGKMIPLRIRPSRYQHSAPPTAFIKKIKDKERYELAFERPPSNAPSINSQSGMTTVTFMSTATTTPHSWHHNWKIQTLHAEYEHRGTDQTMNHPFGEYQEGQAEFAVRYAQEVEKRLDMINNVKSDVESLFPRAARYSQYYSHILGAEQPSIRPTGGYYHPWFTTVKKRLDELLKDGTLDTSPQKQTECKTLLRSLLKMSELQGCYVEYRENEKPHDALMRRLCINESWRHMILTGEFDLESIRLLSLMISSEHSWDPDSDYCVLSLRPRCDKMVLPATPDITSTNVWKGRFTKAYFMVFIGLLLSFIIVLGT